MPSPSSILSSNLPLRSELATWSDISNCFGSAKGYFYLPSSSGLGTYKNPDVLLESLSDPRLSDYHLIISGVGNGHLRSQIHDSFPHLMPRIHFAGFTDLELISIYQNIICIVVPSLIEGFGLPVVEALSFDCIAVIADSPGLTEAGQNCAFRFPASNANYLADLLVMLTDPFSKSWLIPYLKPRYRSRFSVSSPDLFGLCLLAQARSACN